MANLFSRSIKTIVSLVKRDSIRRDLKAKLAEHDRLFLKRITDPQFEDGRFYRMYQEGITQIRDWYDVTNRKV